MFTEQNCLDDYRYYHETFRIIDEDRNGKLTFKEIDEYHSQIYGDEEMEMIMDWYLQFDTTGDRQLDSNEIHEMIKHLTHENYCCEWDEIE